MARVDLPDGQWVDFRERITHGQLKDVLRASSSDDLQFMAVVTQTFVRDWYVLDADGSTIPHDAADAFDRVPSDLAILIYDKVRPLWQAANTARPETLSPTQPSSVA
jgi:hypothetical protein